MVPHVTDAIQDWVERVAAIPVIGDETKPDICVIEVRKSCKLIPVRFFFFDFFRWPFDN